MAGPHSADIQITPPANNVGAPFATYDVKLCLVSNATACFTKNCPAAASNAVFTCAVTAADCADTAIDCLRANTPYTAVAVGNAVSAIKTLPSNIETFTTNNHE